MRKEPSSPGLLDPSRPTALLLVVGAAVCAFGCQPALPAPGDAAAADPASSAHVLLEPEAPLDAAPRVVRIHILPESGSFADPDRALFVRDPVGPGHLRQVEDGDLSEALTERILPAAVWSEDDGSVVVAPSSPLTPDASYGLLSGDPPLAVDIEVAPSDELPLLRRIWPPADSPDAGPFAILCHEESAPLATPPAQITLAPGDHPAAVRLGASPGIGPFCLRVTPLDPAPSATSELVMVPPALTLEDGSLVLLDPTPLVLSASPLPEASPLIPLDCVSPRVPFGPGCALVADDRLFVESPDSPLLWAVRDPDTGVSTVRATSPGEPWVLLGLSPQSALTLTMVATEVSGRAHPSTFLATTRPPEAHLVLTEVLANPLGPEPDQEWVEIYNDGLAPADLGLYTILDIGGETALPGGILAPGGYALVVTETFLADGELDPAPSPTALLLRVPKLGKDGLKNDGEPLKLRGADGTVVSRVPLGPKPKAGQSVTRLDPSSPDTASSFVAATPTPGGT